VRQELDAVAFDLDGTLYPNYRFYFRLLPFIIREHKLLRAMGSARDTLRSAAHEGRFYDLQARIMADILKDDPGKIYTKTEQLIYRGWEPLFKKVRLFPQVPETLQALKSDGLKLGLLSDFPPYKKLEYLGLSDYWDVVLCSEETGRLKPDPIPFMALSEALQVPPERILYVGNSVEYDIRGAKKAGFKAALVQNPLFFFRRKVPEADFIFKDYRQLRCYVLS
jgi:putative hydrolase of the HAD superfamily